MKYMLITLLTLVASLIAAADEGHNHEAAVEPAPNGGILRNAPPFKAELVLEKDQAKIFVYDKDVKDVKDAEVNRLKPVDVKRLKPTVSGKLAFPREKAKREITFDLKDGAYRAKLAGIDKVHRYDLHVTLVIDGKSVLADFGVDNIH